MKRIIIVALMTSCQNVGDDSNHFANTETMSSFLMSQFKESNTTPGGGVFLTGSSNHLTITHSRIHNNQAHQGAGVLIRGNGHIINLKNTVIENNQAQFSGGGLSCSGTNLIKILGTHPNSNGAKKWGDNYDYDLTCQLVKGELLWSQSLTD